MAFPGPGYKSPRKKKDLKINKPIVGELMTKKQKILYFDIAEALLKYFKDGGIGTVYIDGVEIEYNTLINKWKKLSLWFKVEK